MTDHALHRGGPRRALLTFLLLSLALILGALLWYRFTSGHGLLVNPPPQAMQQAAPRAMPGQGGGMEGMMEGMDAMGQNSPEQARILENMQRLQQDANDVDALLALADLFMAQENWASAQGFINRAMVAAPSDERPSYYQGVLKASQGEYEEAAEFMERSLAMNDNPATRYSLAVLYTYHLNARERGRFHLEMAVQSPNLDPELERLVRDELARP